MANTPSFDEFDQGLAGDQPERLPAAGKGPGLAARIGEAWRTRPLIKLIAIVTVVALAIAGSLGVFSSSSAPDISTLGAPPPLKEAPGGKASPFFIDQNKEASAQRADQAASQGGSALPTPVGQNIDIGELMQKNSQDPLVEFRAETDRLRQQIQQEQKQNAQQIQVLQQQVRQPQVATQQEDNSLALAMQQLMEKLSEIWTPQGIKIVAGTGEGRADELTSRLLTKGAPSATTVQGVGDQTPSPEVPAKPPLVSAGTVSYAQLLTEANSDVPSPIMAQILSGPLAGARAIGTFQVSNDFLTLQFNSAHLKGKDYAINAMALDPDTTLAGLVTEVDQRYVVRVILPAAASFLSSFGSSLGQGDSSTTVSNGAVIVSRAKQGFNEGLYSGLGGAAQTVSQFFQNKANRTQPLVRLAVGAPMGLFFLTSVKEGGSLNQPGGGLPEGFVPGSAYPGGSASGYAAGSPYGNAYGNSYEGPRGVMPGGATNLGGGLSSALYSGINTMSGLSGLGGNGFLPQQQTNPGAIPLSPSTGTMGFPSAYGRY